MYLMRLFSLLDIFCSFCRISFSFNINDGRSYLECYVFISTRWWSITFFCFHKRNIRSWWWSRMTQFRGRLKWRKWQHCRLFSNEWLNHDLKGDQSTNWWECESNFLIFFFFILSFSKLLPINDPRNLWSLIRYWLVFDPRVWSKSGLSH